MHRASEQIVSEVLCTLGNKPNKLVQSSSENDIPEATERPDEKHLFYDSPESDPMKNHRITVKGEWERTAIDILTLHGINCRPIIHLGLIDMSRLLA